MEVRLLEKNKDKEKISFVLKDSTPSFSNALRRLMAEEVPTMAIEDVEFRKNTSILYDEVIAHALGLVTLSTDLNSYTLPERCKCKGKGCARCQLKLTLSVKGPATVYVSSLKSKDPAVKPVYPKTPIVKLLKGQALELEATAVLGQGKVHTKWCPGLVHYQLKPSIEIDAKCDACGLCIEQCPTGTLELKDNKAEVIKDRLFDCHLCEACQDICPKGAIKVNKTNDFIFHVESWGQLPCKKIVQEAIKIFKEKLDEFCDLVKK